MLMMLLLVPFQLAAQKRGVVRDLETNVPLRDVIIYGFTVQYQYQLKFLSSATFVDPVSGRLIDRRLNVALTRAKKKEIIVGNPDILSRAPVFRSLIQYCKQHHCYVEE